MWESTGAYRVLVGKLERRDHLRDRRIILRWIFRKCDGEALIGLIWLSTETVSGHLQTR
jgi:hypothetical protein